MSLLREILAYCERTGTAETAFGRAAVGDPNLVADLRRGVALGGRRSAWIKAAIANHPDGLPGTLPPRPRGPAPRRPDPEDPGDVDTTRALRVSGAAIGSHGLLVAMLRLGLRIGGLPGLDDATFVQRCIEAGLLRARRPA